MHSPTVYFHQIYTAYACLFGSDDMLLVDFRTSGIQAFTLSSNAFQVISFYILIVVPDFLYPVSKSGKNISYRP